MKTSHLAVLTATIAALGLGACATSPFYSNQPSYSQGSVGGPQPRSYPSGYSTGTVSSIEAIRGNTSGMSPVGAVIGAVVGGVLGNQVGEGRGKTAATVAGAAGGALAGNEIGKRTGSSQDTYRVNIRLDNGGSQSIDVANTGDLRVGDRVRVDGNQISRY